MNDHLPRGGFRQVIRDCMDLFELQMQLISVDSQEARRKATKAIVLGGVAAGLGASMLTVLMIGTGFLLHENTQLSIGGALMATSVAVGILIVVLSWIAIRAIKTAAAAMSETKSEFAENLRYLKAVLLSPDSSPRNQLRRETFAAGGASAGEPSPLHSSLYPSR